MTKKATSKTFAKSESNKMTAIFLGAGASKAEGAPLQNALFKQYFGSEDLDRQSKIYLTLSRFFKAMFDIDLNKPIKRIKFPTFEEALGVLDLSEMRRESFRGFEFGGAIPQLDPNQADQPQMPGNEPQLIRLYLILIMGKAIADGLNGQEDPKYPHRTLIRNLKARGLLKNTIFITTNYDLVIDSALGLQLDYGVEFSGSKKVGSLGAVKNAVKIFKLHGSLNWLYCPVCNNLNSYTNKAVLSLMTPERPINKCEFCKSVMSPVIVPPTFYKDMSRVFLSSIWNRTENALRDVGHVIFCGYSCPDADMHVKYLLKRMQTNREESDPVRFTLINHHFEPNKPRGQAKAEAERFIRFFGSQVKDTRESFEHFAAAPELYY